MAKVGNETKLILRLARETMAGYRDGLGDLDTDFAQGYRKAMSTYRDVLDAIVADLENSKL